MLALLKKAYLNNSLVSGATLLSVLAAVIIVAPFLYPGDPQSMVAPALIRPGEDARYILGTDGLGHDLTAELMHGAGISVMIGIGSVTVGVFVGTIIGAIGGYFGGLVDDLLTRLTELFQTVPTFLLVMALVCVFEPSLVVIIAAIAATSWVSVARITRAQFRTLRQRDYVLAARTLGYSDARIIVVEILPNAIAPIVANISLMIASAILLESALSFIGLGDPNVVSWGSMIAEGRDYMRSDWYLIAIPGAAIAATVFAFNLVGDGLNHVLNARASS
ncbi:ABC transporter permease [Hyphomicrobium sp.]|uniref:ABC transporter permease n=1 Tax=Hyphomicrobium sp. TaxID=82 RepID=UPI001DBF24F4|nr:ABC transporter permease [Hyphomicrobium sp.]MBY0558575.1 ABC transporter permease [Hyphomicrobium sp.]